MPTRLPFNRKERYFTGTVLPFVVASDDFAHLHLLLDLCGLPGVLPPTREERMEAVQFLTEYGFGESVGFDDEWPATGVGKDTPDVVVRGPDWLLAIEAKLYARQGRTHLLAQLGVQAELVAHWADVLGIASERAVVVALLPSEYAAEVGELDHPVVAWEQVRDAYADVAPRYWLRLLAEAIERYDELKGAYLSFGGNAEVRLTGSEIVVGAADGTLVDAWVGRSGGRSGSAWAADCSSGAWRTRAYEVRFESIDAKNWWPVAEFVADIADIVDGA